MAMAKIRVAFDPESNHPIVFERDVEFTDLREPGGKEFVAEHALSELEKEARVGNHYRVLPSVENFLRQVTQSFRLEDIFSGAHEDRLNTRSMWAEIGHILLRVKHLLAQSRAYHDQEQVYLSTEDPEADNFSRYFHLDKMERFDVAIIFIGKIGDLTARLIFERLGASLIPNFDRNNPEWERIVNLTNIRQGIEIGVATRMLPPSAMPNTPLFKKFLKTSTERITAHGSGDTESVLLTGSRRLWTAWSYTRIYRAVRGLQSQMLREKLPDGPGVSVKHGPLQNTRSPTCTRMRTRLSATTSPCWNAWKRFPPFGLDAQSFGAAA